MISEFHLKKPINEYVNSNSKVGKQAWINHFTTLYTSDVTKDEISFVLPYDNIDKMDLALGKVKTTMRSLKNR